MKRKFSVNTIFTDIGGVLLTNGWDRGSRRRAIDLFKLDPEETEERHHLTFDTYEEGKITQDEYLDRVVFYKKRSFSRKQFRQFMYNQSKPFPEMLTLLSHLKKKCGFRVAVVSNEGRELAEYRIRQFKLNALADFFIVSSFVHFRKPDADIFRIALATAQVTSQQVIYIEYTAMFVQVGKGFGIHGLRHIDYTTTKMRREKFG